MKQTTPDKKGLKYITTRPYSWKQLKDHLPHTKFFLTRLKQLNSFPMMKYEDEED